MKLAENHKGARTPVAVWLQTIFFCSSNNQTILINSVTRENSGAIVSSSSFGSGFCKMKTFFSQNLTGKNSVIDRITDHVGRSLSTSCSAELRQSCNVSKGAEFHNVYREGLVSHIKNYFR